MNSNERLVGADIELLGMHQDDVTSDNMWEYWVHHLGSLPPKGERVELGNGFWAHQDGLTAEYGFTPVTTLADFMGSVMAGKSLVEGHLNHSLYSMDSFDASVPMGMPGMRGYLDMGCAPDYTVDRAGTIVRRSVPVTIRDMPVRECSGHVHISLPQAFLDSRELMAQFVTELDNVVYPLAAGITPATWYRRRRVFRPTSYGVEYRSIGAGTLLGPQGEMIMSLVFNIVDNVWEHSA